MKFLTLKRNFLKNVMLLGLINVISLSENAFGAARITHVNNNENPETQIATILERCLFQTDEAHPFSYYVDELIRIVTSNKEYLEHKFNNPGLVARFVQDMERIRNSSKAMQIGTVLSRYKAFMPASLKEKTVLQLLAALNRRLRHRG